MLKHIKNNKGISLIEAIVTISIFTILIISITYLLVSFYRYNAIGFEQTAAIDSASRGISPTVNNIREMDYSDEGAYPLISAATSTLSFYSDIDTDSSIEKIRVFLDGTVLKKGVTKPAGDPLVYTGQPEVIFTLSENVRNLNLNTDMFSYFNDSGGEVLNLMNVFDVAFVKMNVVVNINPSIAPNDFSLRASAAFRNIKPAVASTTNSNLLNGLVGHFALDDGSGLTVADSTTGGNNGTFISVPTWVTGKIGGALNFDGVDDRVNFGDITILDGYDKITIASWIFIDTPTSNEDNMIVSKDNAYEFAPRWENHLTVRINNSFTSPVEANTSLSSGVWHHVAFTYDGSNVIYYLNGASDGTSALAVGVINNTTNSFGIGGRVTVNTDQFRGKLDDVRMYSRVLSSSEIFQLYQLGGI